ncbi:mevalonate kinase [Ciona intestinalis]
MKKVKVSAPGKIILHGEHAVVHGKRAIACAVDGRITVETTKTDEGSLKFKMVALSTRSDIHIKLTDIENLASSSKLYNEADLEANIKSFVEKNFENENKLLQIALTIFLFGYLKIFNKSNNFPCLNIEVTSQNLPIGASLGSSAAINVAMATAFLVMAGQIQPMGNDMLLNEESLTLINEHAYLMEKIVHGNPSGIDNSVATYGGAASFQAGVITRIKNFPELRFLVTDTKVSRNTKALVSAVQEKLSQYPETTGHILDAIDEISKTAEKLFENWKEIENPQKQLKGLLEMNHHLLNSIGVGHAKLDKIHQSSNDFGFACKLTGAGGGGCAITLIDEGTDARRVESLRQELSDNGFTSWEATLGCGGVKMLEVVR